MVFIYIYFNAQDSHSIEVLVHLYGSAKNVVEPLCLEFTVYIMAEKLHLYQTNVGRLHELKNIICEKYTYWKENKWQPIIDSIKKFLNRKREQSVNENFEDFSHLYR